MIGRTIYGNRESIIRALLLAYLVIGGLFVHFRILA